jgi:polysaccharide deacetylase family protein (PEP-CTERM system associated)
VAAAAAPARSIVNAMSVDVEDYFQVSAFDAAVSRDSWDSRESRVCANTDRMLELFAETDILATFFVLGWVADRFPDLVRRIADAGHEIASHGYHHRLVYELTPEQFRQDIRRAKDVLETISGTPVLGYRAPSFSVTARSLWALDVLIEEGHRYDASVFPVHHDRYGIPGSPRHAHRLERSAGSIVEAPASTVRLAGVNLPIAGGGYFRLLPYMWTRWGIERLNTVEQRPAIFYVHPWEIDPDQPRIAAPALSRLRHYRHLDKTEGRLRRLMRDFKFSTVCKLVQTSCAADGAGLPTSVEPRAAGPVTRRVTWV